MTIIDELNARIERGKASDREVARLARMTVDEYDADTTALDNTITSVQQGHTIVVIVDPPLSFNEYVAYRRRIGWPINGDREAFYDYLRGLAGHRYSIAAWDAWWDHYVQCVDALDLAEIQADALT